MRAMKDSGIEWVGQIPQTWDTKKLKFLVGLRTEKTADKTVLSPYVGLEHVVSSTGTLIEDYEAILDFAGDTLDYKKGDVLFGKLRPYLAKAIQAETDGRCSSEFWVMDPHSINGRFLLYAVLSHGFISCIDQSTFGVKMPRAEWEYAGNQELALPDSDTQCRIAYYLDAKCADIDALITAKEKTNALLKERRQSIIYEAVTKGLNPDALMKDSGIEWIGQIPEYWDVAALKRVATPSTGATPSKANPQYWEGDIPWFSSKDIKSDYLFDSEDHISQQAVEECGLTVHDENSVIICARSGILRHTFPVSVLKCKGTINQDLRVLETSAAIDPEFLMYYLHGMNNTIVTLYQKVGATVESIEMEWLLYLPVALPPVEEQKQIADYIVARCNEIDGQIAANEVSVTKLKEYRQSIIYEAVTGKIEV